MIKNKILIALGSFCFFSRLYAMIPSGESFFDAVRSGNVEQVHTLIQENPELATESTRTGYTALMEAAWYGLLPIAQLLVSSGADVNAVDEKGETALSLSAEAQALPVAQCLLRHGAQANMRINEHGQTVAMKAAASGQLPILKMLIEDGHADLRTRDDAGHSIYDIARARCGHFLRRHFSHPPQPLITKYLNSLLLDCSIRDDVATMRKLIAQGANADCCDAEGETPLMIFSRQGKVDGVRALLFLAHANVQARKNNGETAVRVAAQSGRLDVVRELIVYGADVDIPDKSGMTPLMWAAANSHVDTVKLLVPHVKKMNAKDLHGRTALMIAASIGNDEIIKILMRGWRADSNAADKNGQTALMYATRCMHKSTVDLLAHYYDATMSIRDRNGKNIADIAAESGDSAWASELNFSTRAQTAGRRMQEAIRASRENQCVLM